MSKSHKNDHEHILSQNFSASEWYKVRGQPETGQQLAQSLQQTSNILDNKDTESGCTAALNARANGLAAQRTAATATFADLANEANILIDTSEWD